MIPLRIPPGWGIKQNNYFVYHFTPRIHRLWPYLMTGRYILSTRKARLLIVRLWWTFVRVWWTGNIFQLPEFSIVMHPGGGYICTSIHMNICSYVVLSPAETAHRDSPRATGDTARARHGAGRVGLCGTLRGGTGVAAVCGDGTDTGTG